MGVEIACIQLVAAKLICAQPGRAAKNEKYFLTWMGESSEVPARLSQYIAWPRKLAARSCALEIFRPTTRTSNPERAVADSIQNDLAAEGYRARKRKKSSAIHRDRSNGNRDRSSFISIAIHAYLAAAMQNMQLSLRRHCPPRHPVRFVWRTRAIDPEAERFLASLCCSLSDAFRDKL